MAEEETEGERLVKALGAARQRKQPCLARVSPNQLMRQRELVKGEAALSRVKVRVMCLGLVLVVALVRLAIFATSSSGAPAARASLALARASDRGARHLFRKPRRRRGRSGERGVRAPIDGVRQVAVSVPRVGGRGRPRRRHRRGGLPARRSGSPQGVARPPTPPAGRPAAGPQPTDGPPALVISGPAGR